MRNILALVAFAFVTTVAARAELSHRALELLDKVRDRASVPACTASRGGVCPPRR